MATIKEVAKHSGMSLATVSMVLRGGDQAQRFSAETREKIQLSACELGYRRNFFASQIHASTRKVVMMCVDTIADASSAEVAEIFERRAEERGYKSLMTFQEHRSGKKAFDRDIIGRHGITAVGLFCQVSDKVIAELAKDGVNVVLFDREIKLDSVSTVIIDHHMGTSQAAAHLYDQGVDDVWLLSRPSKPKERIVPFEEYAVNIGKPRPRILCVPDMPDARASVKEAYRFFQEELKHSKAPEAIFATNDMLAYGAICALNDAGYVVGEDVLIVGYGDLWPSEVTSPPLTSVHMPRSEMGVAGADILIDTVEGRIQAGRKLLLSPKLIVRESSRIKTLNK